MEMNNGLAILLIMSLLCVGLFAGSVIFGRTEVIETEKIVVQEKLVNAPVQSCPEVVIPNVENADNVLLNEFLEDEYSDEYDEIEAAAEPFALEELEDHDYRVVVDYLMSLVAGVDEDSIKIDVEDYEVKVTALGLKEDEDKSARVTYEVEVRYRLEEGIIERHSKDLVVVYDVVFEEGALEGSDLDEEVSFVSIA